VSEDAIILGYTHSQAVGEIFRRTFGGVICWGLFHFAP